MTSVVGEGTGTAAALYGIDVAGKTGTAEVPGRADCAGLPNQAWFVGFAPADHPSVVVAVMIENGEAGGRVAGPVVREVMDAYLLDDQGHLKPQYAGTPVAKQVPHT